MLRSERVLTSWYGACSYSPVTWKQYYSLWKDRSWINRRVDSYSLPKDEVTRFSISFDINCEVLIDLYAKNSQKLPDVIPVPLIMTYRAPFLDVDAYIDGKDQSIATTDFSYHFASCVILNILNEMEDCWDLSELPHSLFDTFSKQLYRLMESGDRNEANSTLAYGYSRIRDAESRGEDLSEDDTFFFLLSDLWSVVLNDKDIGYLLELFQRGYPLLVWLPISPEDKNIVLHIRVDRASPIFSDTSLNTETVSCSVWFEAIEGSKALQGPASNQDEKYRNHNYHIRIKAPEGMQIVGVRREKNGKEIADWGDSGLKIAGNTSQLEFYRSYAGMGSEEAIIIDLLPSNRNFLFGGIACSLAVTLIMFMFGFELLGPKPLSPTLLFSIIGLFPTLALLVYRENEHKLVSLSLKNTRKSLNIFLRFFGLSVVFGFVSYYIDIAILRLCASVVCWLVSFSASLLFLWYWFKARRADNLIEHYFRTLRTQDPYNKLSPHGMDTDFSERLFVRIRKSVLGSDD